MPTASETRTPTPVPVPPPQLTITIDGIVYSHDNTEHLNPYSNGQGILDLFQVVSGTLPAGEFIPQPETTDVPYMTGYDWGFAVVYVYDYDGSSIIRVMAPAANGVPIKTKTGGLSVGSTRANVLAAGGWNSYPGFDDHYGLDSRAVPGMDSLMHPGAVGIDFIEFLLTSGKVSQIVLLGNDYGDV